MASGWRAVGELPGSSPTPPLSLPSTLHNCSAPTEPGTAPAQPATTTTGELGLGSPPPPGAGAKPGERVLVDLGLAGQVARLAQQRAAAASAAATAAEAAAGGAQPEGAAGGDKSGAL